MSRRHFTCGNIWKPLHKLPLKKIDRATVAAELRTIIKERGPVAADRGRSTLSAFFGWAIGEGIVEINPVVGTNKASKGVSRERVLSDAELVAIWNAAPAWDYGRIVKLLMLTGQRRDEIADLRWAEMRRADRPAGGANQERPATCIPLSIQALAVLDEGRSVMGGTCLRRGEGRLLRLLQAKQAGRGAGFTGWTLHDLRRTVATGWPIWACSLTSSRRF